LPSQNGAIERIITSRSPSSLLNGNSIAMPRSKPSMITYITTATPMMPAQINGR
jgi:hypothetical protein